MAINLLQYSIIGDTIHVPGIVVVISPAKDLNVGFRARAKAMKGFFQPVKVDMVNQLRQLMGVVRLHK